MKKETVSGIMMTLLLASLVTLVSNVQLVKSEPRTWTVDDDGPADFTIIQEAINAANAGDSIIVREGTYTENVDVDKSLTIKSENGAETTIVQAKNSDNCTFWISADYVNISGFTVKDANGGYWQGGTYYVAVGIYVRGAEYCSVSDNIAYNNYYGICVGYSANSALIIANNVSDNSIGIGVYSSCNNNNLTENIVNLNGIGICLASSRDNILTNNIIVNNNPGIDLYNSSNNIIYHNDFINNVWQIHRDIWSTNTWSQDGEGNYWIDYQGVDDGSGGRVAGDGIGDTLIPHLGEDYYPLMNPRRWTPPEPPIVSFFYTPSPPYNPVVGQIVTFYASLSQGTATQYTWAFGDGNITETTKPTISHSYSTTGAYTVELTVADSYGQQDNTSQPIVIKKPAVVLVHGFQSGEYDPDDLWLDMKENLTASGFTVNVSHYAYDLVTALSIKKYAENLGREIEQIKQDCGVDKVHIVAHSMGGLVARWHIEMGGGDKNVWKLIMLETPNQGGNRELLTLLTARSDPRVDESLDMLSWGLKGLPLPSEVRAAFFLGNIAVKLWSWFGTIIEMMNWPSVKEMSANYAFLNDLNSNYLLKYRDRVHYTSLGGWLFEIPLLKTFDLDGVPKETVSGIGDPIAGYHGNLPNNERIIQRVKEILSGPYYDSEIYTSEDSRETQWVPPIYDKITPNDENLHEIAIGSAEVVNFVLVWSIGDLDLTLETPNGTLITPSSATNDTNVAHYSSKNLTIEGYVVRNPESGIWKASITATNITEEEDYSITTFLDTDITLSLEFQKYPYDPSEPVQITANLACGNQTITDASVTATILKPNNTTETMTLYDDGLHNDNQTNDGIYGNTYTNTSLGGAYGITVTATGTVNGEQFARETFATVWVELYPDLTLSESDIHFSKETPLEGKTITINATIYNIGETDANNVSILFYDENPANGTLIGEYTVNVTAGGAENASIQWNTTCGTHQIHVLISPYNEFLELNYTNNMAHRTIEVTIKGDVNRDGTVDTSDLIAFSKAYGSELSKPNWNPNCDIDNDNKVDALDLFNLSKNYDKTV